MLFQILVEGFQLFSIEYYVGCGFVQNGFDYVMVCSLSTHFCKGFIMNGCWTLSNAFSAPSVMVMWCLTFLLLMWCMTWIDLRMLNNPCEPGTHPTWSWCMIFLICYWIWMAKILLRIFASIFIKDIGLWFYFWWYLCLVLELG